jgi:hypothetical protein
LSLLAAAAAGINSSEHKRAERNGRMCGMLLAKRWADFASG